MSVGKLTTDQKCEAVFSKGVCLFQDTELGEMIGKCNLRGGLYVLESENESQQGNLLKGSYHTACNTNQNQILALHRRLGHPSFNYMKKLFPEIPFNKDVNFQCEIFILAKQPGVSYPIQSYSPSSPFTMIHSDVWGPSRISTINKKRWFVSFIDDHTRLTWLYLMKDKSEVEGLFKQFFEMVKTQFHTSVQVLRTDNGTKYFNQYLDKFLIEKCIVHHSTCVRTP
jgi:hypothetical protein